jgi:hypothetical protein
LAREEENKEKRRKEERIKEEDNLHSKLEDFFFSTTC